MGSITGTEVYYAITDHLRDMEDLNEGLFTDPTIDWNPLSGFELGCGQSEFYNISELEPDLEDLDVVLFRVEASAGTQSSVEMVQLLVEEVTADPAIPTVSEWGLIVITLLMLTAGTVVLGRRRRAAAA